MDIEAMEQTRTRLAAATRAATLFAKSLEVLDESTLQTLEIWLAKQGGGLRCGHCRAQMLRGKESCMCIACGSTRPPLPNSLGFNFKISFAFLRFLETIHPPTKGNGRKNWNAMVPRTPGTPGSSSSAEDQALDGDVDTVSIHYIQDPSVMKDLASTNLQDVPPDKTNETGPAEDGKEADDYGHFQEVDEMKEIETSLESSEEMTTPNGALTNDHDLSQLEFVKGMNEPDLVPAADATSESVSNWDTDWDYPSLHILSVKTQLEDSVTSDKIFDSQSKQVSSEPLQVPAYDLGFFESFGGREPKEEIAVSKIHADGAIWDFQGANHASTVLASARTMERFASDTSAFTTFTDADSDSGESSHEVLPPPKPPLDILVEVAGNNRQDDLLGPFQSHDLGEFQKVPASSDPLSDSPSFEDPFSWPMETLHALSNDKAGDDAQFAESSSATKLEKFGQIELDPFPWPVEEFDRGTTGLNLMNQQESMVLMDSAPSQNEGIKIDPFQWPLDAWNQTNPGVNKGDQTAPQVQVNNTAEDESEDWGEEEFIWSQAEPAAQSQLLPNTDDPFPYLSESSPSSILHSGTLRGVIAVEKERFLLDQSSSKRTGTNTLSASLDTYVNFGNGLESLVTTQGQVPTVGGDSLKTTHIRSLSFGGSDRKPSDLDHVEDFLKRSVSFGDLQVDGQPEGDGMLKALKTPSTSQPAPQSSEPGEDILDFLNLKSALSPQIGASQGDLGGDLTKDSHVQSDSFGELELVPDEQTDEMFQFFHTRSHSAGSSANNSMLEDGNLSGSGKDSSDRVPSMHKPFPSENSVVNEDPFRFIQTALSPSAQAQTVEMKEAASTNFNDDDDDFLEWKSAELPSAITPDTSVQTSSQPSVSTPASTEQDLFHWLSPNPSSFPSPRSSKPSTTGSLSGLFSLANGFTENITKPTLTQTPPKDDDFFATMSGKSSSKEEIEITKSAKEVNVRVKPVSEWPISNIADDSEDEFSDFVSNGAHPSPLSTTQEVAGHMDQPAFDVSFFELSQSNSNEKRNLDFFGDLMALNFTNA